MADLFLLLQIAYITLNCYIKWFMPKAYITYNDFLKNEVIKFFLSPFLFFDKFLALLYWNFNFPIIAQKMARLR